ncbi:RAB39B (predicted) [Pycnogonum litorale]
MKTRPDLPSCEYQFRCVIVGDTTVGKSSLLQTFVFGEYPGPLDPTVGVDFYAACVKVTNNNNVKLQLWDTAGQERFKTISHTYYRNAVGALLVFDVTSRSSFEHVTDWMFEARRQIHPSSAIYQLVGCKTDLEHLREVPAIEAERFANYFGMNYIEASSINGRNVELVFHRLARDIFANVQKGLLRKNWDGIKPGWKIPIKLEPLKEAKAVKNKCCP